MRPPRVPAPLPLLPAHVAPLGPIPRRDRPASIPFFRDPAHIRPTCRLYRALLRALGGRTLPERPLEDDRSLGSKSLPRAPDHANLLRETRTAWRRHRGLTSIPRVTRFIDSQQAMLDALPSAALEATAAARARAQAEQRQAAAAVDAAARPSAQPRLTGAFLRPTLFNGPLPRIKPQPLGLGMMIHHRLRARERRTETRRRVVEQLADMRGEMAFWRGLAGSTEAPPELRKAAVKRQRGQQLRAERAGAVTGSERGVIRTHEASGADAGTTDPWLFGWEAGGREWLRSMDAAFEREAGRSQMVYTPGMIRRIQSARARRQTWKRERAEAAKKVAKRAED